MTSEINDDPDSSIQCWFGGPVPVFDLGCENLVLLSLGLSRNSGFLGQKGEKANPGTPGLKGQPGFPGYDGPSRVKGSPRFP